MRHSLTYLILCNLFTYFYLVKGIPLFILGYPPTPGDGVAQVLARLFLYRIKNRNHEIECVSHKVALKNSNVKIECVNLGQPKGPLSQSSCISECVSIVIDQ
jgi:hypothetical protein